jgi:hypothetical protein
VRHLSEILDDYLLELVERAGPGGLVEQQVRTWRATAGTATVEPSPLFNAGTAVAA